MKRIIGTLLVAVILSSCGGSNKQDDLSNATITVVDEGAQEGGLDLQALGELVKKSANPTTLEEQLNKPGSINNLDLDSNGKVDFIKVTEYADGDDKGLKFTDDLANGTKIEVANVKINKSAGNTQEADMDVNGSPAVYGPDAGYHSHFSLGEVLLMAYLFTPHPMYYSPYGYGMYPGYYRPYAPMPMASYRSTVTTYTSHPVGTVTPKTSSTGKAYNGRSISGNSGSQKSFSTRSSSKPVGSGGFGSKRSSNSSSSSYHPSSTSSSNSAARSSSSSSSSSSRSSSRSSGSSRRSFGGRRR